MIWLTWRQLRGQAITGAALLLAVAAVLAVTGPELLGHYDNAGLSTCHANCAALAATFVGVTKFDAYGKIFYGTLAAMYLAPALMGVFWGAPLIARELETGTHRVAWNQSVTRTRWALVKLLLVGLASMAVAGLLSLMVGWWASPIDHALAQSNPQPSLLGFSRLSPLVFAARGVAPLGYAAFAFALGVTVGVLLRRTIPAMAITLAVFAAVQLLVPNFVRPHLMTPVELTSPLNPSAITNFTIQSPGAQLTLTASASIPGALIVSNTTITPAGHVFTGPATAACLGPNGGACNRWIASKHLRQVITYQPASRFWPIQWRETALYLLVALALGLLCAWRVRRIRS
jgi:ABC-type transport system involved in multi-copper enzyme maturation permease subunit